MAKNQIVVLAGIAVVAAFAGMLVPQLMNQASAQSANNQTGTAPQISGSVNIQNATNAFVKNNVKVSFTDAANTAKGKVENGVVTGGRLSVVQGYLAYTFSVANYDAGTMKMVVVDAGNGSVLYTSDDMPLYNGGIGGGYCGHHGGFGYKHSWNGMGNSSNGTTGTTLAIPGSSL
jgi:uncharacterized membrane protein YkoI